METKNKEIFEKFEVQLFYFLKKHEQHFNHFCEEIQKVMGQLPENELINLYVQFFKNNRLYYKNHVFIFENGNYKGQKQVKRISEFSFDPEHKIKVTGDTYYYEAGEDSFLGVYYDMMKACGYSKKSVKTFRKKIKQKFNSKIQKAMKTQDKSIQIIDYSDKAFVVAGQTKPIKDQLKQLKGRFNRFLKDANGDNYPGWVFSKKHLDTVKQELKLES